MKQLRQMVTAGYLFAALTGCASEPAVVTKVVTEYPTVDRSLFVTQPFPDYPPRPVTLGGMVQAFETGRGLYAVCQARLGEVWQLIQPPCEAGKTDCR